MKTASTTTQPAAATTQGADLARAAAIFIFVFGIYFVGYTRTLPPTADEMIDFGLAQSMAKWQIFSIDQVSTVGPNPEEFGLDGHRYSKYGPLQAVLSVPLFWLAQRLPIGAVDTVLLLNHLVTALAMALLFLLVRRLGYGPIVALAVTALVAFGTPLWIHSKRYFAEPTIALCMIATIYAAYAAATSRRRTWLVLTGLAFGAAVAAKYVDGLLLLPVPLYLAWEWWRRGEWAMGRVGEWAMGRVGERAMGRVGDGATSGSTPLSADASEPARRPLAISPLRPLAPSPTRRVASSPVHSVAHSLVGFAVGVAPVAALLMLYDLVRFGNPLASGYAHWESFSTPIWIGVAGFLFSPGKSIFVYTPLLLLLPFWGWSFARRFPGFSALLGAIIILHLGLYGSWWVWWGAWAWGPRFIVPMLPLVALFLAEGFAGLGARGSPQPRSVRAGLTPRPSPSEMERGARPSPLSISDGEGRGVRSVATPPIGARVRLPLPLMRVIVAVLAALSFVIQVLGISVDHTVYLVSLLPLNPKPDTLTLYDLRYQPILHQLPLMTRQWLDFAWMERTGPSPVNAPALAATLVGAAAAALGFVLVWRLRGWSRWLSTLVVAAVVVAGGTFQALRVYAATPDPTTAAIVAAFALATADTGVVQLIPSAVVPYDNWQKRSLPEIGWIEEPHPNPIVVRRLQRFEQAYSRLWVVTQTPPKAPGNGVEALLDRSLAQVGDESVGSFRLLRYVTHPSSLDFGSRTWQFGDGVDLAGFSVRGGAQGAAAAAGHTFDITLRWRASDEATPRPDYTVFVHLVTTDGKLIAQHDDPPASGYAPTSGWTPGQVVYDDHAIAVPSGAPAGLHLVQVGLYLPSNGKRLPLLDSSGKPSGDTATLDLQDAP